METLLLKIDSPAQTKEIEQVAALLRAGKLAAIPTETVYGLAASALDADAVAGIFAAKGRPPDNPLIIHIAEPDELADLVTAIPPVADRLFDTFSPGPLTLIFPRAARIPAVVSAGLPTVSVRIPSHPVARAILRAAGPLAAPSANRSGLPSPTTAAHVLRDLGGRIDCVVDGGPCTLGVESTVVDVTGDIPRLLRPGAVTLEMLRAAVGDVLVDPAVLAPLADGARPASPGMKYRHYAPRAEVVILAGDSAAYAAYLRERFEPGDFALCFDEDAAALNIPCVSLGPQADESAHARRLFAALRECDDRGARRVFARALPASGVSLAVYNRLLRAAAFKIQKASSEARLLTRGQRQDGTEWDE